MTPAAIIKQAMADGVRIALSGTGTIKASGDQSAVNRWLPSIREHKPGIVAALREADPKSASLLRALTTGEESAIRAWLVLIDETDPACIAMVWHQCRTDADARAWFLAQPGRVLQ